MKRTGEKVLTSWGKEEEGEWKGMRKEEGGGLVRLDRGWMRKAAAAKGGEEESRTDGEEKRSATQCHVHTGCTQHAH